ncbi:TPA: glucuronate isomerase [Candidatus Latescibacteria bacterium]|nr:glucuronate isomerase [Candidatus Latescibacterota bacterium]
MAINVEQAVENAFKSHKIVDIHTHLYPASMGPMYLAGPDELITYHYLKAETSRNLPLSEVEGFNNLPTDQQADVVWKMLFVGGTSPISEAQLGVVTVMNALGLNPRADDLSEFRQLHNDMSAEDYTDLVFEKSGVAKVYMTNDPLDPSEGPFWQNGFDLDPRFQCVLRLDSALMNWPEPVDKLKAIGYEVETALNETTFREIRRYLNDWCGKLDARYMAISLPPDFEYPSDDTTSTLMKECVYPTARDRRIPSAMMVGVTRQVNPILKDGGDSLGSWDLRNLERIARDWPDVNFLMTILSREDQHELCVTARKFPNITPFGCWWFLNNPSIIQEITSERIELLGTSCVPQHSDARILDQLLYKWTHSIRTIAPVFVSKYSDLQNAGWPLTEQDIKNDIALMFGGGNLLD